MDIETKSQAGQDIWISSVFKDRIPSDCIFMDIGAHDGVQFSNSYALEKLGWKGVCVEPGDSFSQLKENRKCIVDSSVISDENKICSFNSNGMLGHIKEGTNRQAITLKSLIKKHEIPNIIQYLSLDVEGHEFEVLSGFPFDECIIEAITVEHNIYEVGDKEKNKIHDLLTRNGYERVMEDVMVDGLFPFEDWYLYKVNL